MKILILTLMFLSFSCSKEKQQDGKNNFSDKVQYAKNYFAKNNFKLQSMANIIDSNKNIRTIFRHDYALIQNIFLDGVKVSYRYLEENPTFRVDISIKNTDLEEIVLKNYLKNGDFSPSNDNSIKASDEYRRISMDSVKYSHNINRIFDLLGPLKDLDISYIGREASYPDGFRIELNNKVSFIYSNIDISEVSSEYSTVKKLKDKWFIYYEK